MSASAPLPRLFGPYLLTRELSRDPLGGVFRAGTTGARGLKPFVLIRAFDGDANLLSPRGDALRLLLYLFGRDEAIRLIRAG